VSLYSATETKEKIAFHQISRSTGERVRHQKVLNSSVARGNDEHGAVVRADEIVKGYEYTRGQYVIVEATELENLRVPSKRVIEVTQFIQMAELNPEYIEKPYFVVPENDAQAEAFAVVRRALLNAGKAAIGKVSFSGRENIVAVLPAGQDLRGMMAYTLRYQNELKNQNDFFRDIKPVEINEEMLELAESLIKKKSTRFDISKFEDGYELALKELVTAKINHLPVPKDEAPTRSGGKVIGLMDALRKSIGVKDAASPKSAKKPPARVTAKEIGRQGIGLVKPALRSTARRKSA
jgi:DNA end-binding protein Ku